MKIRSNVKRLIFLLIIHALFSFPLAALDPGKSIDRYLFDEWKVANGLPSDTIDAIAQTPDGYLWIGTSKALLRFDGVTFKVFAEDGSRENDNWITGLFVDKEGTLWIGTRNGLLKYKAGKFNRYSKENGLSGNHITCINEDIKGNLWFGTNGDYLNRYAGGRFTLYDASKGLKGKHISAIFEDNQGVLWIAAGADGLFEFKGGKILRVKIEGLSKGFTINTIYEERKGGKWRGTNKGLIEISEEINRLYTTVIGGISNNDIKALLEDNDENLWVGTANGINRLKRAPAGGVEIEHYFQHTVITCLFEDRERNIWVGTNGSGLKRIRDGIFTSYTTADGLLNNYIYSLCQDKNRDIWSGAGYGLCRFRNGTFNNFLTKLDNPKREMAADSYGYLWVGTAGSGLFRIKDEGVFNYPLPETGLLSNHITALYIDGSGILWVGTDRGLNRYDGENFVSYTIEDGLSSNYIHSIYKDGDQHIWVGTSNSLNFVKDGNFTAENIEKYLNGVPISSIYEDKQKVLWIGTYGIGLKRFKDGEFFSYSTRNGLSCNNIYKIIEDGTGNFWISSDSGVLKLNKNELNEAAADNTDEINCISFGLSDGMRSIECSRSTGNSAIRTHNGEIWFATKNGISVIDPGKISINKLPPTVIIERIRFNGQKELQHFPEKGFKVKGNQENDVAIDFTATTFISPEKVKFRYMLKGYDRDWRHSKSGLQRNAHYPGLPPGRYTFEVTAGNSDGVWSKPGDSLTFTLQLDFFKTIIFKILLAAIVLIAAAALYFLYKKNFFKQEEKYKSSHLDPEKGEEYLKKLIYLLEVEKVYRDENISLQLLSDTSGIPSHYLSQIINEKMNKNFIALINGYRVEEAKKRLIDPKDKHLSILGIAFEVGFNSKAAFNRAFKRHAAMTPSEYKKKHPRRGQP